MHVRVHSLPQRTSRRLPAGVSTVTFVPCSPKHKSCSRFHADLVREYRAERERQETASEYLHARGELEHWKAMGGKLIGFRDWLAGHRVNR